MEPMNNVSPVKTSFSPRRDMLPWVWPGVCITLRMVSPILMVSPSWSSLSASGEGFVKPKNWAVFLLFSPSMWASFLWIRIGVLNFCLTMLFPHMWSGWPWVFMMYFILSECSWISLKIFSASFWLWKPGSMMAASSVFWQMMR